MEIRRHFRLSWILRILAIFTVCSTLVHAHRSDEEIRLRSAEVGGNIRSLETKWLSAEDKQNIADYVRRYELTQVSEKEAFTYYERNWEEFMVQLGDEPAIVRFMAKLTSEQVPWSTLAIEVMEKSGHPRIIEELVPVLFRDEAYKWEVVVDVGSRPISFSAAATIPYVFAGSTAFNGDVVDWGTRCVESRRCDVRVLRGIMREWWKENEQFFRSKDYKSVRPPRQPPPLIDIPSESSNEGGTVANDGATSVSVLDASSSKPQHTPPSLSQHDSWTPWILLGG